VTTSTRFLMLDTKGLQQFGRYQTPEYWEYWITQISNPLDVMIVIEDQGLTLYRLLTKVVEAEVKETAHDLEIKIIREVPTEQALEADQPIMTLSDLMEAFAEKVGEGGHDGSE
jgi:hypothetical protein